MTDKECLSDSDLSSLIEGYKQFKLKYFDNTNIFGDLVRHGQKPKALLVSCCDSRVDPSIITGCKPGELFITRNVANLVPPFKGDSRHHSSAAALEYGVLGLNVSNIIVLGHSHCGGIRVLMEAQEKPSDFIATWLDIAKPAKQRVLEQYPECSFDEQAYHCEKESLLTSLHNLTTFPWIRERVLEKRLFLHAWYFDLSTGAIETFQSDIDGFVPLE